MKRPAVTRPNYRAFLAQAKPATAPDLSELAALDALVAWMRGHPEIGPLLAVFLDRAEITLAAARSEASRRRAA